MSALVQEYFGKKFDKLPDSYTGIEDIDAKCHELTRQYSGKTIAELSDILEIKTERIRQGRTPNGSSSGCSVARQ